MYLIQRNFTFNHQRIICFITLIILLDFCLSVHHFEAEVTEAQNGSVLCTQADIDSGLELQVQCSILPKKIHNLNCRSLALDRPNRRFFFQPVEEVSAHTKQWSVFHPTRFFPAGQAGFFNSQCETSTTCTDASQISPGRQMRVVSYNCIWLLQADYWSCAGKENIQLHWSPDFL